MVPLMSLIVPILVASVLVFIASSIIHMATPWHKGDLMPLPDEDGVMKALRPFKLPPGNYGFPRATSMTDMRSPAFTEKLKAGPVGFMTIKSGWSFNMGGTLFQWFLYSLAVSVFAGYIAGVAFGPGTEYLPIMQVAGCVAFVGYAMAQMHESIWWGRRWSWTVRNMLDGLLYGLLTGGTFGWLWPR